MSLFNGKYLTDEEIWNRINNIVDRRNRIRNKLAQPNISTDLDKMPQLSKKLHQLNQIYPLIKELKDYTSDLEEIKELMPTNNEENETDTELKELYNEYKELCSKTADKLYKLLIEKGYLKEEIEDDMDLKILEYIEYMGAEYSAMLSTKMGLDIEETRSRLNILLEKDLLERVQGTMLDNYHRQKDWTKHMNHTYYQLSRRGELYLRNLRSDSKDVQRLLNKFN